MRIFKGKYRRILLIGALLLVGYIFISNQKANSPSSFETTTAKIESVMDTVKADGNVAAKRQATLNFSTPGKIAYVGVNKGSIVKKYQTLLGLDAKELATAERASYYKYIAAEANAKEVEDSVKGHDKDESFAQANLRKSAQTTRDAAYDAWLLAKKQLGDANLYAPFNGVISDITTTNVGDTVGPTDGVTVIDPSSLYFEAQIDETDYPKIHVGQEAKISIDAFMNQEFKGKVISISPAAIKTQTGGVKVITEIQFLPYPKELVTALNGEVEIEVGKHEALLVPSDYVISKNNKLFLNVISENKIKETSVEIGKKYGNNTEILSGIEKGQVVGKRK